MSSEVLGLDAEAPKSSAVKLVSKDNVALEVERKSALISNLVKTSLDSDPNAAELPLQVTGSVLRLVVEYMNHHKGREPELIEKPLRSRLMRDVVKDQWDAEFIDRVGANKRLLYDLVLAANYLDVRSLLHLACAKVASFIKGQPLDKVKEILTPEEKDSAP
jgi:S-phase kinase-associated protein 1